MASRGWSYSLPLSSAYTSFAAIHSLANAYSRGAASLAQPTGDEHVIAFAKNFNLGLAIPHTHNGEAREYLPDFLARLRVDGREVGTLILETKGPDALAAIKEAGARRWAAPVNAEGSHGRWAYRMVKSPTEVAGAIRSAADELAQAQNRGQRTAEPAPFSLLAPSRPAQEPGSLTCLVP